MEQYIPKSALVAEIERRIEHNTEWKDACKTLAVIAANQSIEEDKKILSIIDTLEVKEVDLEKELQELNKEIIDDNGFFNPLDIAKHFFKLGLAQNNIENDVQKQKERLLSEIEEAVDSIDYYTVDGLLITIKEKIEELKAQKGE